jgi:hypothetical protein
MGWLRDVQGVGGGVRREKEVEGVELGQQSGEGF